MKRFFLLPAILLLLFPGHPAAETVSRIAAVVDDEIITTRQLDRAVAEFSGGADIPGAELASVRRQVLTELVEKSLMTQRADQLGIMVTEEEIDAAVDDVRKQNQLTREQLIEALEAQGIDYENYRGNLRQQILRFKLIGREVQARVEVTNQEIRDHFRENIEQYREEPFIRLSRITFPIPARASQEQVAEVRARAAEAGDRLAKGEDFYQVLLSYSAERRAEGGDMGTFAEGELTAAFEKAVDGLAEGEISALVETPTGYHLLRVDEQNSGRIRQFDAVKEEIQRLLRDRKTEERLKEWAQELRQSAYIDIRL